MRILRRDESFIIARWGRMHRLPLPPKATLLRASGICRDSLRRIAAKFPFWDGAHKATPRAICNSLRRLELRKKQFVIY